MCHVSTLTNALLPLPPLQEVSPHLQCAMFLSSPTRFSHFLPSSKWVGSSVIHMGDHNVPNALLFIGMWLHPPSQKSFVSWPTGIHHITRTPYDANRQVLADLPHPPSHLQYALPTTSAVQVAYTACIHQC